MIIESNAKDLRRQARFGLKHQSIKATIEAQSAYDNSHENMELLINCQNDWDNLRNLRLERARNIRYKNGNQWGDIVRDPITGDYLSEDVLLSSQGKVPLKYNFIQQFVRNLHGQMLGNKSQSIVYARAKDDAPLGEMLTNTLGACNHLNQADLLNLTVLEDLLLGGIACAKVRYTFWPTKNRPDGRLDIVNINRLFFNTDIEDQRMFDLRRIGEIHDYTLQELIGAFATTTQDEQQLRQIYGAYASKYNEQIGSTDKTKETLIGSFLIPDSSDKCRVIEAWQKVGRWVTYAHDYADGSEQVTTISPTQIENINAKRLSDGQALGLDAQDIALIYHQQKFEYFWRVKYLTPNGVCIKSIETPYTHEEHPYVMATMPMTDGAIKSVIGDIIDIQRYINRLVVMIDFIMGSSAKGVLMIPEECIPEEMTVEDFASEWVKANGVIVYKAKAGGVMPSQISTNAPNIGAVEMLNMNINLIHQISGISGAIQGQTAKASTPSSLYAQEAQNSSINYKVVFEMFSAHIQKRDDKLLKVLMQYYTDKRHVDISGKSYKDIAKFYDPEMARKIIDFNLIVSQSIDTPVFRQVADDMLFKFLENQFIDFETFLENCSLPFADKLKSEIKQKREQQAGTLTTEQMQQMMSTSNVENIAQQANPKAMELMQKFIGK